MVIVGNDQDAQITAIAKGAGMLVVVWTEEIADEVLEWQNSSIVQLFDQGMEQ